MSFCFIKMNEKEGGKTNVATKLKNLKIKKVDFVDEGANPDAHIKLFKMKDSKEQPIEEDSQKGSGSILKKLFCFIGKAAGMAQEEIDSAVDEIQKGDSISFKEKLNETKNRKIADEIWDICYALQSSLCSILCDEEMDSSNAATAMQESLEEFTEVVKAAISQWASGKEASVVIKNEDISQTDLEIMKSAAERLNEVIEKAAVQKDKQKQFDSSQNQEGDRKKMKIDKSKLTDAEKAFLESIEKRYGTQDEQIQSQDGMSTTPAAQVQQVQAEPIIAKSITQTEQSIQTTEQSLQQALSPNQQTNGSDTIYKGLHPAVAAELEGLKKFKQAAEDRELHDIAKKYTIIGKKEEELVPLFKSLKAAGGTAYQDMITVLDQAVETVEKSGAFSEIGKSGHNSDFGGEAWAEAEAKAVELRKSKMGLSMAQALDEVFINNPELAKRCEEE